MQIIKKHPLIIGLIILIGLSIQTSDVNALYSPTISRGVSEIQQHILNSQAQNGNGPLLDATESVVEHDKENKEKNIETGISGRARIAQGVILAATFDFTIAHPLDSLLMVFNFETSSGTYISNCLRNDIWSLEALRDLVGVEMVKAYLVRDDVNGNILMKDYSYLVEQITLLRQYGWNPYKLLTPINISSNEYFFGKKPSTDPNNPTLNYYSHASDSAGCPEGEFNKAINEVRNSWKTFTTLSQFNAEWGDIWKMARTNARIRAGQWIKANQISLTLGGENGARIQSLVKGGGWDKFTGNVKTQAQILENMVGPVTPFWDFSISALSSLAQKTGLQKECAFYDVNTKQFIDCTEEQIELYKKCKDDDDHITAEDAVICNRFRNTQEHISIVEKVTAQQELQMENNETKKEVEQAFIYNISLDSVAEQTSYELNGILWDMNMTIKRGYEGVDKAAGQGIPTLITEIEAFSKKQCANKK